MTEPVPEQGCKGFQRRAGWHTRSASHESSRSSHLHMFQIVARRDPRSPTEWRVVEVDPGWGAAAVGQHDVGLRTDVEAPVGLGRACNLRSRPTRRARWPDRTFRTPRPRYGHQAPQPPPGRGPRRTARLESIPVRCRSGGCRFPRGAGGRSRPSRCRRRRRDQPRAERIVHARGGKAQPAVTDPSVQTKSRLANQSALFRRPRYLSGCGGAGG